MMQGLPHAPCRLQPGLTSATISSLSLPPHAPCRLQLNALLEQLGFKPLPPHAPCRLQRFINSTDEIEVHLCLHTPRADCNLRRRSHPLYSACFASTRPVQIATRHAVRQKARRNFASTRPVQIATATALRNAVAKRLCLHTPRADCNGRNAQNCNMHFSERVLSR